MGKKYKKTGKGQALRPCHVCYETVNFVVWEEESKARGRKIHHWANPDGSHHVHFQQTRNHLNEIMQNKLAQTVK